MKSITPILAATMALLAPVCHAQTPTAIQSPPGKHVAFLDTFSGTTLGNSWITTYPGGGTTHASKANPEHETYTSGNVTVNGLLSLTARKTWNGFSSGMVCSYPQAWRYGWFEASVLLPSKQGVWPAVWLRGTGSSPYWEVDLIEAVNRCDTCYQTVHYSDPLTGIVQHKRVATVKIGPGWHKVAADVELGVVTFYVDGKETGHLDVDAPVPSYAIINLAVGGSWPGTPAPLGFGIQTFDVAYFAVWQ